MLDFQFGHREVCNVRCGQYRTGPNSRGSYQAVCLVQGYANRRVLPAPATGTLTLRGTQRRHPQRLYQATSLWFLFSTKTAPNLFDGNSGHPGFNTLASQRP